MSKNFSIQISKHKYPELEKAVNEIAERFGVSKAVAIKAIAESGLENFKSLPDDEKRIRLS